MYIKMKPKHFEIMKELVFIGYKEAIKEFLFDERVLGPEQAVSMIKSFGYSENLLESHFEETFCMLCNKYKVKIIGENDE